MKLPNLLHNPIVSGYKAKSIKAIESLFKSKMIYTVNMSNSMWIIDKALNKCLNNMPQTTWTKFDQEHMVNKLDFRPESIYGRSSTSHTEIFWYKKTPILIDMGDKIANDIHGNLTSIPSCRFSTINTKNNIKHLKEFLRKLQHITNNYPDDEQTVTLISADTPTYSRNDFQLRNFDNVYMPKEIEDTIKESIDHFLDKKKWYNDNSLPYHYGILLYGPPGTGKTSIAQAIARYVNKNDVSIIMGDDIFVLHTIIGRDVPFMSSDPHKCRSLIIEDFDCGLNANDNRSNFNMFHNNIGPQSKNNKLATLLNTLDGCHAPSNIIFIFTTNHIDNIDPALLRPGRIDLKIEISYVNKETFKEFCKHYYPDSVVPDDIILKDSLTFAELQTRVMKEESFDEILNYVTLTEDTIAISDSLAKELEDAMVDIGDPTNKYYLLNKYDDNNEED